MPLARYRMRKSISENLRVSTMENSEWAPTFSQCFTDQIRRSRSSSNRNSHLSLLNLSCNKTFEAYFLQITKRPYWIAKSTTRIDTPLISVKISLALDRRKDHSILCGSSSQSPQTKLNQRTYFLQVTRVYFRLINLLWISTKIDHANNSQLQGKVHLSQTRLKSWKWVNQSKISRMCTIPTLLCLLKLIQVPG